MLHNRHFPVLVAAVLLAALVGTGSAQDIFTPSISSVTFYSGPAQLPGASTTDPNNLIRVFKGLRITLRFQGSAQLFDPLPGGEAAWVASSETSCACVETLCPEKVITPATLVNNTDGALTASWTVNKVNSQGPLQLCFRSRDSFGNPRAWNFYGSRFGLAMVSVQSVSRTKFYVNQAIALTLTGTNLLTGDRLGLSTLPDGVDDGSCSNAFPGTYASAISAFAGGTTATITGIRETAVQTGISGYRLCWTNSLSVDGTWLDTGIELEIRPLTEENAVYWGFPRFIETTAGATTILAETKVRFSGWNVAQGDVFSLYEGVTDCRTAAAGIRFTAVAETIGAFNTAYITIPAGWTYKAAAPGATTGSPVKLSMCYFPLGMDDANVIQTFTSLFHTDFYAVSATDCDDGDVTTNVNTVILDNSLIKGNTPIFLRGVQQTVFISGCTKSGDVYSARTTNGGDSCAANSDVWGLSAGLVGSVTVTDGSFPRVIVAPRASGPMGATPLARLCLLSRNSVTKNMDHGTATYAQVGATGDFTVTGAWTAPTAYSKPGWYMLGATMPLPLTYTSGNTASTEEFLLTFGTTDDACAPLALDAIAADNSLAANSTCPYFRADKITHLSRYNNWVISAPTDGNYIPPSDRSEVPQTVNLCIRVNTAGLGNGLPYGISSWKLLPYTLTKYPLLRRWPTIVQPLALLGDRTGAVTYFNYFSGDRVSYSTQDAPQGECHGDTIAQRIDLTLANGKASFPRVDGNAKQFSPSPAPLANRLCLTRNGDTRSYLFPVEASTALTIESTLQTTGITTEIYAGYVYTTKLTNAQVYAGDRIGISYGTSSCAGNTLDSYSLFDSNPINNAAIAYFPDNVLPPVGRSIACILRAAATTAASAVPYAGTTIRVVRVEDSYSGVTGTAKIKTFLVQNYISYLRAGDETLYDIRFAISNWDTNDYVTFTVEGTKCENINAALSTFPRLIRDGPNYVLQAAQPGGVTNKFMQTNTGGRFELCYRPCKDAACNTVESWVGTGKFLQVVKILTGIYPGSLLFAEPTRIYINGAGIQAGDKLFLSNSNTCPFPAPTAPTLAEASMVSVDIDPNSNRLSALLPGSSLPCSNGCAVNKICYLPDGVKQHSTAPYAFFDVSYNLISKSAVTDAVLPAFSASQTDPSGKIRFESGVASSVLIGTATATVNNDHQIKFIPASAADCTAAPADSITVGPVTRSPDTGLFSRFAVTARVSTTAELSTFKACYRPSVNPQVAYQALGSVQFTVASVIDGFSPDYILRGRADVPTVTVTLSSKSNPTLFNIATSDLVCFVLTGDPAPAKCGSVAKRYSVTVDGTIALPINDFNIDADWDVFYHAGGNVAIPTGAPVRVGTSRFRSFGIRVRPLSVTTTGANGVGTSRALYVKTGDLTTLLTSDRIFVTSGSTCAGAAAGATAPASDGRFDWPFPDVAAYNVCYRSGRITATPITDSQFAFFSSAEARIFASTSITASFSPTRVQSGVQQRFVFSGTVQDKDSVRFLLGNALNNPTCGGQTTTVNNNIFGAAAADLKIAGSNTDDGTLFATFPANADPLPVCYLPANKLTNQPWQSVSGTASLSVITVTSFYPVTMVSQFPEVITFSGQNLAANDFSSFVHVIWGGCSKSWFYENALVNVQAGLTSRFVLPGGTYNLCYWAKDTTTGYKFYSNLPTLRVVSLDSITPGFVTSAAPTVFTLSSSASFNFDPNDQVVFVPFDATDCSITAGPIANISLPSLTFTSNLTANPGGSLDIPAQYRLCTNLVGSVGYKTTAVSTQFQRIIRDSPQAFVKVFGLPKVGSVFPKSILRGAPSIVTITGANLAAPGDLAGFVLSTTTCLPPDLQTNVSYVPTQANAASERNRVQFRYNQTITGFWNLCYQYSRPNATNNPDAFNTNGIRISVVDVTGISPTGTAPTAVGAGVEVTFQGFFNNDVNDDWVGLIPKYLADGVTVRRDCADFDAPTMRRPAKLKSSFATSAFFNTTNNVNEYLFCYHFGGTPWTGNVSADYTLLNPEKFDFSVRQLNRVAPLSILSGFQQTIYMFGYGLRTGDSVVIVNMTTNQLDCVAAASILSNVIPVTARRIPNSPVFRGLLTPEQNAVLGSPSQGFVTVNLVPAAQYRLCYSFRSLDVQRTWILASDILDVAPLDVFSVVARQSGSGAEIAGLAVPRFATARIVLTGRGLAVGDQARLASFPTLRTTLNLTLTPNALVDACNSAPGTAWQQVAVRTLGLYEWQVPSGEFPVTGDAIVCYKSAIAGMWSPRIPISLRFVTRPELAGFFPRLFSNSSLEFQDVFFYGRNIALGDKVTFKLGGNDCSAGQTSDAVDAVPVETSSSGSSNGTVIGGVPLVLAGSIQVMKARVVLDKEGPYMFCYFTNSTLVSAGIVTVSAALKCQSPPVCSASARYRCGCTCQSRPCSASDLDTPTDQCSKRDLAGFTYCGATGVCAYRVRECPVPQDLCSSGFRCPQGQCAKTRADCDAVEACPPPMIRCIDGTCTLGVCATGFNNTAAQITCTGDRLACPLGVCPLADGTCPAYNGCHPERPYRCGDCSCVASLSSCAVGNCTGAYSTLCADGTCAPSPQDCKCAKTSKFAKQAVGLFPVGTLRRGSRFGALESAALTLNVSSSVSIDLPAGLFASDSCALNVAPVSDSDIEATVISLGANIVSTPVSLVASVVVTASFNASTQCLVADNKVFTVKFTGIDASPTSKVSCSSISATFAAAAAETVLANPNEVTCRFNSSAISATGERMNLFVAVTAGDPIARALPRPSPSPSPFATVTIAPSSGPAITPSKSVTPSASASAVVSATTRLGALSEIFAALIFTTLLCALLA